MFARSIALSPGFAEVSDNIQADSVAGQRTRLQTHTVLRFGVLSADELRPGRLEVSGLQVSRGCEWTTFFCFIYIKRIATRDFAARRFKSCHFDKDLSFISRFFFLEIF